MVILVTEYVKVAAKVQYMCGCQYRLLEGEIQQLQKETAAKEKEFFQQIEHLKKENNRQQKLIIQVCNVVLFVVCCLCLGIYSLAQQWTTQSILVCSFSSTCG